MGGGDADGLPPVLCVRGLLSEAEVSAAMSVASAADTQYNVDADSVDSLPAYELYPVYRGEWQHPELEAALRAAVEGRLLPLVRAHFHCPECVLCDSLLRRYRPGERRRLPVHSDDHAFVTATFLLNAGHYGGGLFVQRANGAERPPRIRRGPQLSLRRALELRERGLWPLPRRQWLEGPALRPGDALLHQGELLHGVRVLRGSRYSLIFWIARSRAACLEDGPQPEP